MRFNYDECDNILSESRGESYIEYQYSDSGELRKLGDKEFKYDNLGRLTYKSGNSIQYNEYNMMSNFNAFKYFYDAKSGLRSAKEMDGTRISFVLDDFGRVIEERNESNDVISSIEWNGDLPYIYHYGGNVYRYLCNAHGDVVALVDEDGVEVNSYSYDIFGKLISEKETIPNAIRYRHEYYDAESGMYYLRGRYYDPAMRRFTTPDPAEDGINHYAYCGNNPFMNIDPSGYAKFVQTFYCQMDLYVSGTDLDDLEDYFRGYSEGIKDVVSFCVGVFLSGLNKYLGAALGVMNGYIFDFCSPNLQRAEFCKKARRANSGVKATFIFDPISGEECSIVLNRCNANDVAAYEAGKKTPH